jgi:hypothetical protein
LQTHGLPTCFCEWRLVRGLGVRRIEVKLLLRKRALRLQFGFVRGPDRVSNRNAVSVCK